MIDEGVNGRIVRPRDVQGLAEAMLDVLRDAPARARMGEASRRIVAERFSRSAMIRGYEELFERLLKLPTNR
jgi:glycosyltransferase involved in cell wall biosynthesis